MNTAPPQLSALRARAHNRQAIALFVVLFAFAMLPLEAREKTKDTYGEGVSVELDAPENEVLQVVEQVVNDGIIEGSKEYSKDKDIGGAKSASSSPNFPAWTGPGKVFYKVRTGVLDPQNFKDSNDVGTLTVRYVLVSHAPARTNVRIDAVFVEDFRHRVHQSNGSVELAEFKVIKDTLDKIAADRKMAAEAEQKRKSDAARREALRRQQEESVRALALESSPQNLEQRVADLRRQVERLVRSPGAELKSAPFQSATTLKTLRSGSEVVILIDTPYWYGIESADGQHGWVSRQQLEPLP